MSGEYSIIYVFNKLSNTIESILYDKYDKQIHMPINDKLLEKLFFSIKSIRLFTAHL